MATERMFRPGIAVPPGAYLTEVLEFAGMSQAELARRAGRPAQAINEIVKGTKEITAETALQLEHVLDVPAHVWINLERNYRYNLARLEDERRLQEEAELLPEFRYSDLARSGVVKRVDTSVDKVRELLRFFAVASLESVPRLRVQEAAFRRAPSASASPFALAAWLRRGELEAARIDTSPFDQSKLKAVARELPAMTLQDPAMVLPGLRERLAGCGVALVVVPEFPKTCAFGATFWLEDKAVLQVSLRGKRTDIFWFSLAHELAHILLHGRRGVFVQVESDDTGSPVDRRQEDEADDFARATLIPDASFQELLVGGDLSHSAIRAFASRVGVAPGVVAGRLARDGRVSYAQISGLRHKYEMDGEFSST